VPSKPEDYGYKSLSSVVSKAQQKMLDTRSGIFRPVFTSSRKETKAIGGFYPSDQIVIAGRPGGGKTARLIQLMVDFCDPKLNPTYVDNLIILYDSYEMADWRNVLRMISRKESIEVKSLLDHAKALEQERFNFLVAAAESFKGLPIYISSRPVTAHKWMENKKQIQGLHPKKTIINLFDHTRLILKHEESREEEKLYNLLANGMELKNNQGMINFFLSQMNRNIETGVSREKIGSIAPVSSDIFGSDFVYQSAEIVMALHRPGSYGIEKFEGIPTGIDKDNPDKPDNLLVECLLKQREGWTGNIYMKHNLAHNKIEDYDLSVPTKADGGEMKKLNYGGEMKKLNFGWDA